MTHEERKKEAKPWLKHAVCHDILITERIERIEIIEKILTTKGFMQAEKTDDEKSKGKALL